MRHIHHSPPAPQRTEEVINAIQQLFKRVAPLILERAGKSAHTDKRDGSPVTDTDVEVEEIVRTELVRRFPGISVFGEEAGYGNNLPDVFWLVDPIDGTKSFIAGEPRFTSMAVLIQNGEATASVIYNPSAGDMYVAQAGQGAYKNGERLDLHTVPLPHIAYCKQGLAPAITVMLAPEQVTCQEISGGGGYGFTMVASGVSAARFNLWGRGHTHDYAPGALLVREAGGAIIPVAETQYTYETRSFIACHPGLELLLTPLIPALRKLEHTQE